MAYKIDWAPLAISDLRSIVTLIADDNPSAAESFGFRLMSRVDGLESQPEMGPQVPEHGNPGIRQLILKPYRIIYRVDHERRLVEIVRIWHGARGRPEFS